MRLDGITSSGARCAPTKILNWEGTMRYDDLRQALDDLSLEGPLTLQEIKERHHDLVKCFHPDAGGEDPERIRQINAAYRTVMAYCRGFRFAFTREEFLEQDPEERLRQQFADDPIWGS
jgi:hypothetical protein